MKAMAATKCAPFITSALAVASAAKEHEELMAPKSGRQSDALGIGATQIGGEPAFGNECLYHGADEITQDKGPAGFPEKAKGRLGRLTE